MVRAALSTGPALLALITAGCFDIVAPGERDPSVHVDALVIHDDTLSVQLTIRVDAGADGAGRAYELSDPTIYLNATAVHPVQPPRNGVYEYAVTLAPAPPLPADGVLQLRLPALPAAAAASFVLPVPLVRRSGTAAIQLSRGEDLVIGVALPAATVSSYRAQWWLELRATSCTADLSFARQGALSWPPATITVPWSILQATAPSAFHACLGFFGSSEHSDPGYTTHIGIRTEARWRVEIRD